MRNFEILSKIESIDRNEWTSFVEAHPNGNLFQTPYFFDLYNATDKYEPIVVVVYENNSMVAVQLAVNINVYGGVLKTITSRSIIFGGPIVLNDDNVILKALLSEYINIIKYKALFSEFRNMWDWTNNKEVFLKLKIDYEDHLNILMDLNKGEDQLWKEMKRVRRKSINQGIKKEINIREIDLSNEDLLNNSYKIIQSVYNRIKLPLHDISFFKNAQAIFGKHIICLGVYVEEKLIAVRIALCYGNKVFDWYAGAENDYLSYRPNDVLPWEIMKWGIQNNYNWFDFGGAGKPDIPYGVRDHKMKFGGELVNHGRFKIIHKPILFGLVSKAFYLKQRLEKKI